jgi:biotin carboxyl carrier protein
MARSRPTEVNAMNIIEVQPGIYSVIDENNVYEAFIDGNEVTIAGERFDCTLEDPRQWKKSSGAAGAHGKANILAPMPGKIVRILVSPGDEVKAGQGLIVVEAMKMQNEMKSPRDGRVTTINVKENDSVTAGAILASIE